MEYLDEIGECSKWIKSGKFEKVSRRAHVHVTVARTFVVFPYTGVRSTAGLHAASERARVVGIRKDVGFPRLHTRRHVLRQVNVSSDRRRRR